MPTILKTDTSTAWEAFAITPSDSADLIHVARGIYVGGAGDISLVCEDGDYASPVTFVAVPVGMVLPVRAKRVRATGTTATNLVGLI